MKYYPYPHHRWHFEIPKEGGRGRGVCRSQFLNEREVCGSGFLRERGVVCKVFKLKDTIINALKETLILLSKRSGGEGGGY